MIVESRALEFGSAPTARVMGGGAPMRVSPGAAAVSGAVHPQYLYLDALRGWAILMVMLIHVGVQLTVPSPGFGQDSLIALPPWIAKICVYSRHGVQLFFIVSAMSLTFSALARDSFDLGAFAIRRFLRIAPMFYLAIVLYLVRDGWGPRAWAPHGIDVIDVAATFGFVNIWRDSAINSVVPGDWSISAEMNFYALLPCAVWIGRRSLKALLGLVLIAFAADLAYERIHHVAPGFPDDLAIVFPSQLPTFLIGVATAVLIVGAPPRIRTERWERLNRGFGAALLAFIVLGLPQTPWAANVALFGVLCCGLAYTLHASGESAIANRAIARIGTVSFSMYLMHFALLPPISRLCLAMTSNRGLPMLALDYAAVAAATFVFALAAHRFVETPFIRLGARLSAQWTIRAGSRRSAAEAKVADRRSLGVGAVDI